MLIARAAMGRERPVESADDNRSLAIQGNHEKSISTDIDAISV